MCTLLNDLETLDRHDRARDDVRRRRAGHGHARRAPVASSGRARARPGVGSSVVWGVADFSGGSLTRRLPTLAGDGDLAGRGLRRAARGGRRSAATSAGGRSARAARRRRRRRRARVVLPRALARDDERRLADRGVRRGRAVRDRDRDRRAAVGLALAGAVAALGGAVLASVDERRSESADRARAVTLAVVAAVALGLFVYFLGLGVTRRRRALDAGRRAGRLALVPRSSSPARAAVVAARSRARRSPRSRRSGSPT